MMTKTLLTIHVKSILTLLDRHQKEYKGDYPNTIKNDILKLKKLVLNIEYKITLLDENKK